MLGTPCKLQIQIGIEPTDKLWVDGKIIQMISDGRIVVRVPKSDELFYCNPEEVFINLKDFQNAAIEFLGVRKEKS
jgi:hypothetical protein